MMKGNIKKRTIIISGLLILVTFVLTVAVLFYGFGVRNAIISRTVNWLHFPVAIISGNVFVTAGELADNLSSVKKFYENQDFSDVGYRVDFTTADGQNRLKIKEKDLLNKLIENNIVEKLAISRNIIISKAMVSQNVSRKISQLSDNGEYVSKTMMNLYGWTLDDFEEKIVQPDMYREELEKNMRENDMDFIKAKNKITQAQSELKNGTDFVDVVKKYSEGDSSRNGGDLGWFTFDQMMPEIATTAFIVKKGERSDIVESSIGFHIVQVDDKKIEDGISKVRISQIIVRKKNFSDWLLEQEKNMRVIIPIKEYRWNKENATVDFVNTDMQDFEKNLYTNSAGDISIIF
ncbi:MAG: Foldase protein PrsA [Candidatus Moranbacteria bacterium GW2011_GWA2_39_41]|nr:MAG: Foldase protein PrsA [Candidatus Moranbacteria bacterium GW2011_GWA2_39_41]